MAMTTRTEQEEEEETTTLLISNRNQNDDDSEEETLSLCDLPVNSPIKNENEFRFQEKEEEEEFEFGSSFRVGSDSFDPGPEMSTADELFFKGRILPFRHSVSLDGVSVSGSGSTNNRLFITRSESADFRRTGINRSDRDSSQIKIKNRFIDYSQPSPNPQIIRRSSSMTAARVNPKSSSSSSSSSSIWDFLRLGLVRTPEIELRNAAKLTVSRNSSCSSTSTSSNSRSRNRRRGFFFGDCKCSVSTEVVITTAPVKIETEEKKKKKNKKTEKSAMARSRTFEWLKELSQVAS